MAWLERDYHVSLDKQTHRYRHTDTHRHAQTPTVYDVTVKWEGNRTDPAFGKGFVTGSWDENPLVGSKDERSS